MNLPLPADSALAGFHPAVSAWFSKTFPTVTAAQARAWPLIRQRRSTLIAAPTGSGKTLTAFLAVLDDLVHRGLENPDGLPDETLVVYVSPLKALSNDIRINLQNPLAGITEQLQQMNLPEVHITTAVRTGDTPQKERAAMRKTAPHILVTTPESLYVLLGSESGRKMLGTTRTVIIDEIHAMAAGKRGSHLALSLERLQALCAEPLTRIGLSATQKPVEAVAQFLVGHERRCEIIDIGHARPRDLGIEVPPVPLSAVMANDVWELVYDRLAELAREHRTTLIFVNTRRLAERLSRHLSERLGKHAVAAHHGSLAKEFRLDAEQRLKRGELQVLIATASLELGIDIGEVDLVCQIASPRSIAGFLQRVGRSGHQVGGTPKGRLFATTRDDLIECTALLDCVRRGELDTLHIPVAPLDVLAQQIIAEVSCQEWSEDALLAMFRQASPYRDLDEKHYQALLSMLAEGYNGRQGIRSAYLHRDAVSRTLRGRRGSQLTAVTSGGTIPDNADYSVMLEPQGLNIGSVNEDFAVESIAGDVFQLGNTSYRILRVETGKVRVEDAHGQPPTIPFWLGEAPGRSDELSSAVARLQAQLDELLGASPGDLQPALDWLTQTLGLNLASAEQLVEYLARAPAASIAPGAWPCASVSAAPSISNCRRLPAKTRSCCRCPPATALNWMSLALPAQQQRRAHADSGGARCAAVRCALALERRRRAGIAAFYRRPQSRAAVAADEKRRPDRQRVSRPDRLPGKPSWRTGNSRASVGRTDPRRLPARGDGQRRLAQSAATHGTWRSAFDQPRFAGALTARGRNSQCQALHLSRRRTAGRTPHPSGDQSTLERSAIHR
jgi:ATP-dependent Lhr-like helicase